ncbi:MAG: hypothetical protein AB8G95_30705 [Anaerolineae bacterium]
MASLNAVQSKWVQRVVFLSLLLLFFTIPHTLEDFAGGEPAEAGIPAPVLAMVVSTVIFIQALGLYWLGQRRAWGLYAHIAIGLFWPIASGFAQLPTILSGEPYRAGFISVLYLVGMILIGILMLVSAIIALIGAREK